MKVGINALFWIPDAMGGTQTYFLNLIRTLVRVDRENSYLVFLNKDGARDFRISSPNLQIEVCPVLGRARLLRLLWENLALPGYARRRGVDLLHSLGYLTPPRLKIPSVITVMDMIHYIYPSEIKPGKRLLWRALFPASLRRADRIISISESARQDIARFFPWAASKTASISLGVDHALFKPALAGREFSRETARPFILAVGSILPHKNLETLIRAFARLSERRPDLLLALAGMSTTHAPKLRSLIRRLSLEARVRFLGRIPEAELVRLYRNAEAFVFPSFYEGFGLPPVEAMACGCPVIASNRSSIPEVCGSAALLFDPEDAAQLASAMESVLSSEPTRAALRRRGLERAAAYTWEAAAGETLALYRSCREGPHEL